MAKKRTRKPQPTKKGRVTSLGWAKDTDPIYQGG